MAKTQNLSAEQFALEAAKAATERLCTNAMVLDLTGISPATDYFVIATTRSNLQGRNVADEICKLAKNNHFQRFGQAGYEQGRWILIDFIDVVVHLFDAEYREYYELEMLWGDAKKLKIDSDSKK